MASFIPSNIPLITDIISNPLVLSKLLKKDVVNVEGKILTGAGGLISSMYRIIVTIKEEDMVYICVCICMYFI